MARDDIDITLPDLAGRRVVLTGGSDGMGLIMADRLAAAGADLVLPVRNRAKGEAVAVRLRTKNPGARVSLHDLDLSSLASVRSFGTALTAEGAPVHLLINNAGVMTPPVRPHRLGRSRQRARVQRPTGLQPVEDRAGALRARPR
ncbi:SDR family NAD(P)-dependent oxidoreductase [Microbacterium sp. HMWF026]|uniref:SDR family NAD(P)-dependent oxidoreductase n=1 Tax=Microbacterium sp. HMWF026 TaxID=2056861 RepID=UPI00269040EF|nr:SDR family NAD(P)-dependent oxidoreductase [Microbacterium sp. HMWF026]